MKIYTLKFEQKVRGSIDEVWNFFSSPLNLAAITPRDMNFIVTSDFSAGYSMYPGMIISYKVSPLLGIKMNWLTEITHVKEKEYFIDEQRFGPFAFWHHEHHFKSINGGVLMNDMVSYGIPYGFIGNLANRILVAKQVQGIFDYREKKIGELFGSL